VGSVCLGGVTWHHIYIRLSHKISLNMILKIRNINNNYRLIHGLFHIALVISTRPWYRPRGTISVEGWWKGQYEKVHVLIYLGTGHYLSPGWRQKGRGGGSWKKLEIDRGGGPVAPRGSRCATHVKNVVIIHTGCRLVNGDWRVGL
jgi:hypothetical protein